MINHFYLNKIENIKKYKRALDYIGIKNPYYTLDYLKHFSNGIENASFFLYQKKEENLMILMPGYIQNINIDGHFFDYKDFSSPYGYYGPLTNSLNSSHLSEFWEKLEYWYNKNNVIAEFIRFDLYGNHIGYNGQISPTLLNIKGKIIGQEEQWMKFDRKVRKNVKKAQRHNLRSEVHIGEISETTIECFYEIYLHTMKRTNASESFFYSKEAFFSFVKNNPNQCAICIVYSNNIPISSEFLLISDRTIFSFLGGTLDSYFDKRPNDFLKFEVINWARENNFKYFVLGGGYGSEDGIYRYKKAFFPEDTVNYFTGRKIINQHKYNEMVTFYNELLEKKGLSSNSVNDNFFPYYRKKISD